MVRSHCIRGSTFSRHKKPGTNPPTPPGGNGGDGGAGRHNAGGDWRLEQVGQRHLAAYDYRKALAKHDGLSKDELKRLSREKVEAV
jgi:hypothetical protein